MVYFLRFLILVLCFVVGYLFGSIPNGVLISKIFYGIDPRESGSHNTGGTNVGRVVSKKAGIITITLDIFKIIVPFIVSFLLFTYVESINSFMLGDNKEFNALGQGNTLSELAYYLVAFGGMIGHSYSLFLKFKGGKIVATYCGFALSTSWTAIPFFMPIFFITLKIKKYVSLSSLTMCGSYVLFTWIVYIIFATCGNSISGYLTLSEYGPHACIYFPVLATLGYTLLVYRHKSNIIKIINHTENTAGWNKSKK